jgi:pilus assembly protein CpaB
MKWSILVLVGAGLVAALAATFLVAGLSSSRGAGAAMAETVNEIDVLFAAKALPALSVIDSKSVVIRKVAQAKVPPNAMSDPVAVVGKVLRSPMIEGQAVTPAVLASRDSGINLAAAVREGMRAVSLSLADADALENLLYPGSVVDVLFSFKAPSGSTNQADETISLTLLKAVQVLAVEGRTILSTDEPAAPPLSSPRGLQRQMVTLMVTPKQAELLQLAQKFGAVSLAMRNPMDNQTPAVGEAMLSQLSEFFNRRTTSPAAAPVVAAPILQAQESPRKPAASQPATAPAWSMTVIRGGALSVQDFPSTTKQGQTP